MKRTGPTNLQLKSLISELRKLSSKEKCRIWKRIAEDLEKPTRKRREVNINRLNMHTENGETVIVPGKVLGIGNLDHKINVAAFRFSEEAMEKINKIGKAIKIEELMKSNPKGKGVKIIG